MRNFYKITALFFATAAFLINICADNYGTADTYFQETSHQTTNSFKLPQKLNLFVLNRHSEKLVVSYKHLPITNTENQTDDFYSNSFPSEKRKSILTSAYLLYSENISINLDRSIIIFPFHYFW
jgi:hypothetical protein